jgi:hypothetical protein
MVRGLQTPDHRDTEFYQAVVDSFREASGFGYPYPVSGWRFGNRHPAGNCPIWSAAIHRRFQRACALAKPHDAAIHCRLQTALVPHPTKAVTSYRTPYDLRLVAKPATNHPSRVFALLRILRLSTAASCPVPPCLWSTGDRSPVTPSRLGSPLPHPPKINFKKREHLFAILRLTLWQASGG